jgi:Protein of unknown function (DUF2877)
MHPVMSISILGPHARRFVERHASARVAAVFSRSLHLESAGDFVCIGDPSIGRGPLNAVLDLAGWTQLTARPPPLGKSASIVQGAIRIGTIALDTTGAERWHPTAWPSANRRKGDLQAVQRLQGLAADQAPRDGLARIVLGLPGDPCSALERVTLPRVERLQAWIAAGQSALPPIDLLGLGPGLTPSGDDVLCGVLVALHAVGWTDLAGDLHAQIAKAAPSATSPISRAFLRAAAEGLGCEALHEAISAVLAGQAEALAGHIEALGRIGHTSGWDALAGAVLVLQAFGTMQGQRAAVASAEISE